MKTLFVNIGGLAGVDLTGKERRMGREMDCFGVVRNGWLLINGELIEAFGQMSELAMDNSKVCIAGVEVEKDSVVDVGGGWIFPSFCDSHTHIVYAGDRAGEFLDKINGLSYEEIAARGGGILNSVDLLRATSEDDLFNQAMVRVDEMIAKGTGAIEIKSGYGLSTSDELKMLRVIRRIKESVKAEIKATFLGAHAVSREYLGRQDEYVDLVCREMIPAVAAQGVAEFIDVFCDTGYFTPEQTQRIVETGVAYGLTPKIHANELDVSGGVQVGVECGALSVDHLERTGAAEFDALALSATMPTLLPGSSFFLGLPYADGREMIRRGLGIALASDYNPGSSPSGDMRFVASLGCIRMKLTPAQSLNAATINGAYAMNLSKLMGSLSPGKLASFFLTEPLPSLEYMLYAYTSPVIRNVWLKGSCVKQTIH